MEKAYGCVGTGVGRCEYKIHADDKSSTSFKNPQTVKEALKIYLDMDEVNGFGDSMIIEAHLLNPLLRAFEASQITDYIIIPSLPNMRRYIYPFLSKDSFAYIVCRVSNNSNWKISEVKCEHRIGK